MVIFDQQIESLGTKEKRTWSFVSLLFSVSYFTPHWLISELNSPQNILLSVVIFLAFVGFYTATILLPIRVGQWCLLAVIGLGLVGVWHNPAASVFLGYASFVIAYYAPVKRSLVMLTLILVALLLAILNESLIGSNALIPIFAGSMGIFVFGLLERRATLQSVQQQRSERAIEKLSALAERERIGRDLHDTIGHALSAIALKAELAEKRLAKQQVDQAKLDLNELATMSREALSDVRQAVSGMQKRGLVAELHKLEALLEGKVINVQLSLQASTSQLAQLNQTQESELIMVAKEIVTNIIKHSNASAVTISLEAKEQNVYLNVTDNGKIESVHEGNGIKGMRERLLAIHGELTLKIQEGLHVIACVPLKLKGME